MKKLIKSMLAAICWFWSKVYPYNLNSWLINKLHVLYSLWIQNFIGDLGEKSYIHYPCSLQGGGTKRIRIGYHTHIQSHSILGCWNRYNTYKGQQTFTPEIVIGNNCSIGEYNQITAINKICIGDGLLTGRYVYIGDNAHGGLSLEEHDIPPAKRMLKSKGAIIIGNNVWIGDKVTILGGVTIGDNVIIGANSVVTHDVPSNTVVAGQPLKVVKSL